MVGTWEILGGYAEHNLPFEEVFQLTYMRGKFAGRRMFGPSLRPA
jgi:hypothetical protein